MSGDRLQIRWDRTGAIGEFDAATLLESALARVRKHALHWVVVTVPGGAFGDIAYHAFRANEVEQLAAATPERRDWPLERALDLDRRTPGFLLRGGPPRDPAAAVAGARILDLDDAGRVIAVGEFEPASVAMAQPPRPQAPSWSPSGRAPQAPPARSMPPPHAPLSVPSSAPSAKPPMPSPSTRSRPPEAPPGATTARPPRPPSGAVPKNGDHAFEAAPARATEPQPAGSEPPEPSDDLFDLGPMRGGHAGDAPRPASPPRATSMRPPASPEPEAGTIEVTLSAEAPARIAVGATARVPFQVELTSEAMPLAVSRGATARKDLPIVVALSVENDAIEVLRNHECTVEAPASGEPRSGFFAVRALRAGACRAAVAFRQGGSDLGVIALAIDVVADAAAPGTSQGRAVAAPRDPADDDKLALLIEQRAEGGQVFYEYTLHSEALGLPYRRVRSRPLLDSGGGPAATAVAFVERIYQRVTRELKSRDDLAQLQREARALGASLCEELLDPDVARLLWPLRDRLRLVQIVSWEPYIPWELVRLRDPETGDIDTQFLCEYGLVRTLSDEMPARTFPLGRWAYLGAQFPHGSFPSVGAELDYFTASTPDSLRAKGFEPKAVEPSRNAFYAALADGDFDVLHIACHAESDHASIENASLVLGDEASPGAPRPALVEVDTVTVSAEAKLRSRRPIVFLNACETGRAGAVLTAWGGWPNVFLRRGAGAFVGTSWAVRDKPAAAFSRAFYNALIDGATLAEAASAARSAAKAMGDASWLAFKVYGHPRARRAPA